MTVYQRPDGKWWARVWGDHGEPISDAPTDWDGEGNFYAIGLDYVVKQIPEGYAYPGSASWDEGADGSFTTVLYRAGWPRRA